MEEKVMASEENKSLGAEASVDSNPSHSGWQQFQCTATGQHFPREEVKQIWKECQNESFWYRALPLSTGSMAVTGGLIYNGVWKQSKRFGYFPKLLLAGLVGFAVGKASYFGNCREKFNSKLGPEFTKAFPGPGFGPGGCKSGQTHCIHICEKCKQQEAQAVTSPGAPES
ncbi:hypothetical protein DNTS_035694 [Danionella cerebrum]|uniref:OCIA domain-containing protein n=1 Tax=Danionella cerebrum TaxID=2873325 RepID=A0A553REX7_9TELE|nr:hypothetical protein DNTS_035694 [Danionella translucida]